MNLFLGELALVLTTHPMRLTGFRATTRGSPASFWEAIANVGEVQTSLPLQTVVSGSGHRAQRSHIFPPQPWVKAPTHPAITTPLVNGVFPRVHTILEMEVPRQRARIAVWTPSCNTAVLEQGGALTLPKSQHYHQTTLLPAPGGRGSEWYFLVFAIKSKHHVLVKNKMVSMFRILPSTWHLRLSIKLCSDSQASDLPFVSNYSFERLHWNQIHASVAFLKVQCLLKEFITYFYWNNTECSQ